MEAVLIVLHILLADHQIRTVQILGKAFSFTTEVSLPTVWSVVLASSAATVALSLYFFQKHDSESPNRKGRFGWLIAAFLFGTIALDDAVGFHERIGAITSLDFMEDIQYKSYPWHITVAPIFGIAFIAMITLILPAIRKIEGLLALLILALSLFALALGIDFLEGIELMAVAGSEVLNEGTSRKIATLMVTEEISEMAGTILFLHIFVSCFCSEVQSIEFKKREPESVEG